MLEVFAAAGPSAVAFAVGYEISVIRVAFTAAGPAALPLCELVIGRALGPSAVAFTIGYVISVIHVAFTAAEVPV
jgi:hypothetical protein